MPHITSFYLPAVKHQLSPTGTDPVGLGLISQLIQITSIIHLTIVKSAPSFKYTFQAHQRFPHFKTALYSYLLL